MSPHVEKLFLLPSYQQCSSRTVFTCVLVALVYPPLPPTSTSYSLGTRSLCYLSVYPPSVIAFLPEFLVFCALLARVGLESRTRVEQHLLTQFAQSLLGQTDTLPLSLPLRARPANDHSRQPALPDPEVRGTAPSHAVLNPTLGKL